MKRIRGAKPIEKDMDRHIQLCFVSRMREISGLGIDTVNHRVPGFLVSGDDETTTWVECKNAGLMPI